MDTRRARLLSGAALALLAAACAGSPQSGAGPVAREVTVTASEFTFEPAAITLRKGERVTLALKNGGAVEHDLQVVGLAMPAATGAEAGGHDRHTVQTPGADVHLHAAPRQTQSVTLAPDRAGTYAFYCTVPGHKEAGMTGQLRVD